MLSAFLLAIGMLCIYLILNLHIKLDALYIDHNGVDINLDASQHSADAYTASSFTMHYLDSIN